MNSDSLLTLLGNGKVKKVFFTSACANIYESYGWKNVPEGASLATYSNGYILELTYQLSGFTNINKMLPILFVKDLDRGHGVVSYYNRISSYTLTDIKVREEHDSSNKSLFNFDLYVIEYE